MKKKTEPTPGPWETDGMAIVINLPEKYHEVTTTRCIAIVGDEDVLGPLEDCGLLSKREVKRWEDEDIANAELIAKTPQVVGLLRSAVDQWAGRFKSEEDINGADCVDWLAEFIEDAQKILKQ